MTRVLPRTANPAVFQIPACLAGARHRTRFHREVSFQRPLPAGFRKGLTKRCG